MRVLHVYSGNLYGGVESALSTIARSDYLCPSLKHEFALCFEGRLSKELKAVDATVHQLGGVRVSRPQSIWSARRSLRSLLQREAYDAVISHSAWVHALFGRETRRAGLPLVFWLHGAVQGRHWTERWAMRTSPDLAICNSRFTSDQLPVLWPEVKREVLYYLIARPEKSYSEAELRAVRTECSTSQDATVIIQVSRIEACKGHIQHLEALSRLRNISNWVCWIVGGSQRPQEVQYKAMLEEMAAQLGVADRMRFLGERTDVARLLSAADIFCQPNTGPEGFGIVFIEALYAGLPIITTNMGGGREIVEQAGGILVPPGDVDGLAEALRQLLQDQKLRESVSVTGIARAELMCDPQKQLNRLQSLIAKIQPEQSMN